MREQGTFPLEFNYEVVIAGLIDARMFCPDYASLLTYTDLNYLVNGFPVFVFDTDVELRGIYQCIDITDLSNPNSWEKVGIRVPRTPLQITDGANPDPIVWAVDPVPGGGMTYLQKHGAFPMIAEENKGDDGKWTPNAAPAYSWNTDRSILSLFPQTTFTNFIII